MALGGGTFTTQNKILPGSYINFVSAAKASATLSDRGIATMPLSLDWGVDGEVFEVTPGDFQKNSLKIFGYSFTDPKMAGLRDLFMNVKKVFCYKLTSGGAKADNTYCTAKYSGVRGNDLKVVITTNVDEPEAKKDIKILLDTTVVFEQLGVTNTDDLKPCDFVDWKSDVALELTANLPLTSGTNAEVTGEAHQAYLDKIESFSYNTMGVVTDDLSTKKLYVAFVKRMRDQVGQKFQCVLYDQAADYEGIINVNSKAVDSDSVADLVYWVTGAEAGCPVNKSLLNTKYDGEFAVDTDKTQSQLEDAILKGELVFHNVNGEVRVLMDINSFVSDTPDKTVEIFGENQCVRVMDQIANDIAVIFNNRYLGKVPNDDPGRVSFWSDIVKHHEQLQNIRAIQNFSEKDVTVVEGDKKNSVVVNDAVTITVAMAKLYMTVTVA